ncbi:conjugative transposon protein TraG [Aquipluma nitroreducens]|uniref:Conjugative transposon protein TraG n=1 Tax=Aquipluma nitroreducens TaxID=2010828 RepID=A0A5K7S440_9BACT|nr:TraG family conjugative transposon ATPase [Aquipluma nitroreducens]BBE16312.1 conjugative transposon protein TraG [Aquipluma nitroreducens]
MKIKNLETILPILGFNNDIQVSNNLDMTIGFRLQLPEVLSCSTEKLYMLHDTFQRMINLLPAGSFIHKQDFFLVNEFHPTDLEEESEINNTESLNESYLEHFDGRHYLKHDCCFYISLLNKGLLKSYLESALIFSRKDRNLEKLQYDKINELKGNVMAIFQQNGIVCKPISMEEAIGDDHSLGLIERFLSLNFTENHPALGGIDFRDRLKVMDQFVEVLSLSDYSHIPAELRPASEHPQTGLPVSLVYPVSYHLPFSHITNQFIYIPDQQDIKGFLEGSYKKIFSLSKFSSENKVNSGLIESFLDQVQTSGEKIVKTHFNVMLFNSALKDLKQHKSETSSAFSMMNCFPYQHTHDLPMLFFSCVPFSTQLPETELFITQVPQACCLTNFEGELKNSNSDFTIRLSDRLEGCPVKIDISDEPTHKHLIHNRNKIIIGGSGSGKSFFTNHLLRQYAESGNCHIVLLDVGRSYELLTIYLNERLKDQGGAMMVEFTTENPISFNPFILEGELDIERKQTILSVIYTIYKENLSEMEKDVIAHSLTAFFESDSNERSFNGYYEFCESYIPTLVKEQSIQFNSNEFFFILGKYYRGGEYDYLLNKQMDTDEFFRCPFIVFELDNIKDHATIFPVATLIIIDIFMQKMRRLKGVRKVLCIEEAWKAIATPQMASYIKYFYKTIRKFFGEAMVVTQEVDDVISSPVIRDAIINNADTRILLDMSKFRNKFQSISDTLGLSDFQKDQILSINKNLPSGRKLKEVFIGLGSYSQVYALEVSKPEYYCYTSEQSEKEAILKKLQEGQDQSFVEILKSM